MIKIVIEAKNNSLSWEVTQIADTEELKRVMSEEFEEGVTEIGWKGSGTLRDFILTFSELFDLGPEDLKNIADELEEYYKNI